jgi:hypothetical protein
MADDSFKLFEGIERAIRREVRELFHCSAIFGVCRVS